jgi:hypothetical protein
VDTAATCLFVPIGSKMHIKITEVTKAMQAADNIYVLVGTELLPFIIHAALC